jgi:fatty acid desaturase
MPSHLALEVEVTLAGGQVCLIAFVLAACIATAVLLTYVLDNVQHDRSHRERDRDP